MACLNSPNTFYWLYSPTQKLPLELFHLNAIAKNIIIDGPFECFSMRTGLEWNDKECSFATSFKMVCEFDNQGLSPIGRDLFILKPVKLKVLHFLKNLSKQNILTKMEKVYIRRTNCVKYHSSFCELSELVVRSCGLVDKADKEIVGSNLPLNRSITYPILLDNLCYLNFEPESNLALLHVKMDFEAVGLLKSSFITKDEIKHFS